MHLTNRLSGSAPRRRANGQILVIFAGGLFLFVGMCAIVTDVSWYWANTLRVQRAADAAALAGVVYLPGDLASAVSAATADAKRNGYVAGSGGVTLSAVKDPSNDRRLDVSLSAPVGTFFMRLFGITTIQAARTSEAEYVLPVPMGSPQAYFGVGCFVLATVTPNPACTAVATSSGDSGVNSAPSGPSHLNSQGFWGAISARGGNQSNGDAYAPENNAGYTPTNNINYDRSGYSYTVSF